MPFFRYIPLVVCFLVGGMAIASLPDNEVLDDVLLNWYQRADAKPEYMYQEGKRIFDAGKQHVNCDSVVLGGVLMFRACNNAPGSFEYPDLDALSCEFIGQRAFEEIAFRDFIEGRYEQAVDSYKRGLEYASDPGSRVKLMQAIGTSYMQADVPDSAVFWYTASADLGLEYLSAINFSNISNAYLGAGNPAESLVWSKRAEAQLVEEFQSGLSAEEFAMRLDLILNNQVLALLDLGELQEAERTFQRMSMEAFYPNMAAEFYHLALLFAWAVNDPYPVEMHRSVFERELVVDSVGAVMRFGPMLALIDPWRSKWESQEPKGSSIWTTLRSLPDEMLPELRQRRRETSDAPTTATPGHSKRLAIALIWLLGGAVFFARQWKRSVRSDGGVQEDLDQIRQQLLHPTSRDERAMLRAFNGLSVLSGYPEVPANLSSREVDVMMAFSRSERPKDTAIRLGISTKSVYMIRTEVKKKIGLGAEENLGDWLAQYQDGKLHK